MKKILSATEFAFVTLFFTISPIFQKSLSVKTEFEIRFSLFSALTLFCCALIFYAHRDLYKKNYSSPVPAIKKHSYVLLSFGLLFLIAAVFELLNFFLLKKGHYVQASQFVFDFNLFSTISLIVAVLSAAFCEEVLYRFYLPDFGKELFKKNRATDFFIEIASILIFALGHRYLGVFGFFNAVLSGCVLRVLFVKGKSLWLCFAVHSSYNLFTIFILQAL